jgi:excisionase family DNA binding protein
MPATRPLHLLRIPEAAERLNVSRASVYRWIEEGRLPAVQLGGRGAPLRIDPVELEVRLFAPPRKPPVREAAHRVASSRARGTEDA